MIVLFVVLMQIVFVVSLIHFSTEWCSRLQIQKWSVSLSHLTWYNLCSPSLLQMVTAFSFVARLWEIPIQTLCGFMPESPSKFQRNSAPCRTAAVTSVVWTYVRRFPRTPAGIRSLQGTRLDQRRPLLIWMSVKMRPWEVVHEFDFTNTCLNNITNSWITSFCVFVTNHNMLECTSVAVYSTFSSVLTALTLLLDDRTTSELKTFCSNSNQFSLKDTA